MPRQSPSPGDAVSVFQEAEKLVAEVRLSRRQSPQRLDRDVSGRIHPHAAKTEGVSSANVWTLVDAALPQQMSGSLMGSAGLQGFSLGKLAPGSDAAYGLTCHNSKAPGAVLSSIQDAISEAFRDRLQDSSPSGLLHRAASPGRMEDSHLDTDNAGGDQTPSRWQLLVRRVNNTLAASPGTLSPGGTQTAHAHAQGLTSPQVAFSPSKAAAADLTGALADAADDTTKSSRRSHVVTSGLDTAADWVASAGTLRGSVFRRRRDQDEKPLLDSSHPSSQPHQLGTGLLPAAAAMPQGAAAPLLSCRATTLGLHGQRPSETGGALAPAAATGDWIPAPGAKAPSPYERALAALQQAEQQLVDHKHRGSSSVGRTRAPASPASAALAAAERFLSTTDAAGRVGKGARSAAPGASSARGAHGPGSRPHRMGPPAERASSARGAAGWWGPGGIQEPDGAAVASHGGAAAAAALFLPPGNDGDSFEAAALSMVRRLASAGPLGRLPGAPPAAASLHSYTILEPPPAQHVAAAAALAAAAAAANSTTAASGLGIAAQSFAPASRVGATGLAATSSGGSDPDPAPGLEIQIALQGLMAAAREATSEEALQAERERRQREAVAEAEARVAAAEERAAALVRVVLYLRLWRAGVRQARREVVAMREGLQESRLRRCLAGWRSAARAVRAERLAAEALELAEESCREKVAWQFRRLWLLHQALVTWRRAAAEGAEERRRQLMAAGQQQREQQAEALRVAAADRFRRLWLLHASLRTWRAAARAKAAARAQAAGRGPVIAVANPRRAAVDALLSRLRQQREQFCRGPGGGEQEAEAGSWGPAIEDGPANPPHCTNGTAAAGDSRHGNVVSAGEGNRGPVAAAPQTQARFAAAAQSGRPFPGLNKWIRPEVMRGGSGTLAGSRKSGPASGGAGAALPAAASAAPPPARVTRPVPFNLSTSARARYRRTQVLAACESTRHRVAGETEAEALGQSGCGRRASWHGPAEREGSWSAGMSGEGWSGAGGAAAYGDEEEEAPAWWGQQRAGTSVCGHSQPQDGAVRPGREDAAVGVGCRRDDEPRRSQCCVRGSGGSAWGPSTVCDTAAGEGYEPDAGLSPSERGDQDTSCQQSVAGFAAGPGTDVAAVVAGVPALKGQAPRRLEVIATSPAAPDAGDNGDDGGGGGQELYGSVLSIASSPPYTPGATRLDLGDLGSAVAPVPPWELEQGLEQQQQQPQQQGSCSPSRASCHSRSRGLEAAASSCRTSTAGCPWRHRLPQQVGDDGPDPSPPLSRCQQQQQHHCRPQEQRSHPAPSPGLKAQPARPRSASACRGSRSAAPRPSQRQHHQEPQQHQEPQVAAPGAAAVMAHRRSGTAAAAPAAAAVGSAGGGPTFTAADLARLHALEVRRRRQADEQARRLAAELAAQMEQLAGLHRRRAVFKWYGMRPWLQLLEAARRQSARAEEHRRLELLRRGLQGFARNVVRRRVTRVSRVAAAVAVGRRRRMDRLARAVLSCLAAWARAAALHRRQVQQRVLLGLMRAASAGWAAWADAEEHARRRRLWGCLMGWRQAAEQQASERLLWELQKQHEVEGVLGRTRARRVLAAWRLVRQEEEAARAAVHHRSQQWAKVQGWLREVQMARASTAASTGLGTSMSVSAGASASAACVGSTSGNGGAGGGSVAESGCGAAAAVRANGCNQGASLPVAWEAGAKSVEDVGGLLGGAGSSVLGAGGAGRSAGRGTGAPDWVGGGGGVGGDDDDPLGLGPLEEQLQEFSLGPGPLAALAPQGLGAGGGVGGGGGGRWAAPRVAPHDPASVLAAGHMPAVPPHSVLAYGYERGIKGAVGADHRGDAWGVGGGGGAAGGVVAGAGNGAAGGVVAGAQGGRAGAPRWPRPAGPPVLPSRHDRLARYLQGRAGARTGAPGGPEEPQ